MLWPLPGLPLLHTSLFIWCECIMFGLAIWVLFFFTPAIDDDGDHQLESTTTTPPPPPRLNVSFVEWWWCFFWVEFFFTRKKTWLEMKIWFFSGNTRILLIHSIPNFLFSFFSIANSCVCLCVCVCVAGYIQFKTNK